MFFASGSQTASHPRMRADSGGVDSPAVMLDDVPGVVRRYFELDPHRDGEGFVALFADDAIVTDEGETYQGTAEIRTWRKGPATKYNYTTEISDAETLGAARYLVTGRLTGDFPGGTAALRWEFTVSGELISRLVIAP